jgi:3,4-dihydroxy 2-butanone 4-phosphate synthase/GTP cyclohydrolase II
VVVVLRQQESPRELAEAVHSFAVPAAVPAAAAPSESVTEGTEGTVLRTFGVGAQILTDLGVKRMRVLSAPKQMHGLSAFGLQVESYVGDEG